MTPVETELARLGRMTSDEIAADLKQRRCKGRQYDPDFCPVAVRLKQVGKVYVSVGVEDCGTIAEAFATPPSVAKFIERFDADKYPQLIAD